MDIPMSGDEVWLTVIATGLTVYFWAAWYVATWMPWPAPFRLAGRGTLWITPLLAAALIATVLKTVASYDVVNDFRYLYMYVALGMAWVGAAARSFGTAGLLLRDDAVERRNAAVPPALSGAILGVAACYAGGNIGDGPGWWVVVLAGLFATLAFIVLWHALEALTGIAAAITVERDEAAGWRLGGFLFATGLLLGRSVAGDWVSTEGMVQDALAVGWPVIVLLVIGVGFERTLRGTVEEPQPSPWTNGVLPALVMVGLAVAYLSSVGIPQ